MSLQNRILNYLVDSLWLKVSFKNYMLLPLSIAYILFTNLRYDFFQTPIKCNSTIVCVGNAIVGGAGKTPIVIRLVELLSAHIRIKIAVVAKGYKGSLSQNRKAVKVELTKHTHEEVGDEALLIAKYTDVFISKKRVLAVKLAEKYGAKIIILDDGFQDNSILKDFSILVINTHFCNPATNTFLIPAGPMRANIKTSVRQANIIIITDNHYDISKKKFLISKDLFYQQQIIKNKIDLKNKNFFLLCGIAQPERVMKTAKKLNANILASYFFPDHCSFSVDELKKIYTAAKKCGCKVLTTKKDFVRIDGQFHKLTTVIDYSIQIDNENQLIKKIIDLL